MTLVEEASGNKAELTTACSGDARQDKEEVGLNFLGTYYFVTKLIGTLCGR